MKTRPVPEGTGRGTFRSRDAASAARDLTYNRPLHTMRVARRFVISGRVQGVGFRWFTQDAAAREGATGWVRNLPDGRVEALVEGEDEAVTRVERALRSGPRGARVEEVAVDEEEVGGYKRFTIER